MAAMFLRRAGRASLCWSGKCYCDGRFRALSSSPSLSVDGLGLETSSRKQEGQEDDAVDARKELKEETALRFTPSSEPTLAATEENPHWSEIKENIERADGRRRRNKFAYSKLRLSSYQELRTPKGVKMLRKLGLDSFMRARPPKLNAELCDAFLSTYVHGVGEGHGVVGEKVIHITPEAVHRVTGLPLGGQPFVRLSREQIKAIRTIGNRVHSNVYDLSSVTLSEEDNDVLLPIASLLMEKMCMTHVKGTVAGRVLWGLRESLFGGPRPEWSSYMAEMMRTNASLMRTTGLKTKRFRYGRWLTAIIKSEDNAVVAQPAGHDAKEVILQNIKRDFDWKERQLKIKEDELNRRERNLRNLLARWSKFAHSLRL